MLIIIYYAMLFIILQWSKSFIQFVFSQEDTRPDRVHHPFINKASLCLYHSIEMLRNSTADNGKPPERRKLLSKALEVIQRGTCLNLDHP